MPSNMPDSPPAQLIGVGTIVTLLVSAAASGNTAVAVAAVAGIALLGVAILFHDSIVRKARNARAATEATAAAAVATAGPPVSPPELVVEDDAATTHSAAADGTSDPLADL